jgi:hypothetical protein
MARVLFFLSWLDEECLFAPERVWSFLPNMASQTDIFWHKANTSFED